MTATRCLNVIFESGEIFRFDVACFALLAGLLNFAVLLFGLWKTWDEQKGYFFTEWT